MASVASEAKIHVVRCPKTKQFTECTVSAEHSACGVHTEVLIKLLVETFLIRLCDAALF